MSMEKLFGRKYLLSGDWDRVVTVLPKAGDDKLLPEDYVNRAFGRCFQATKDHRDGNYSDVVADATAALVKDCTSEAALCAQAYGFYLNDNYEQAISVCEKIVCRHNIEIQTKKDAAKSAWDKVCEKPEAARDAAETAQEALCQARKNTAFAQELLGKIYADMGKHLEASRYYKEALLYRLLDPPAASPLLMDAYRDACKRVKGN